MKAVVAFFKKQIKKHAYTREEFIELIEAARNNGRLTDAEAEEVLEYLDEIIPE